MKPHLLYKSVTFYEHNIPTDPQDLQAFAQQVKSDYLALQARHKAEIQNRDMMITKLRHQLFGLRKDKFGSSGEGLDQLGLRLEDEETGQELNIATTDSDDADKASPKVMPIRRALPKHLPRTDVKHLPDTPCAGCGANLDDSVKTLGEDVMDELEYVPGRFVVNRIIRPRLSCAACETISQAPMPSRPIPKSYAGPGLLASIIVNKYADHLPLYRQSQIMAREGIDIDRSTLSGWVGRSAHLLERLSDKLRDHVLSSPSLFADDTTIKLLASGNGKTKTARMWIYSCDQRPWAGGAPQAAWYQFSPDRKGIRTEKHLEGYTGFIHADGYADFNKLYAQDKATEMACMAHIRRKFVDIFEAQGSAIAAEAIKRIATLYAIEKQVRGSPPDERVALRLQQSKPILETLEHWLSKQLTHISGKSPLAGAIRYALTRIPKVRPYLTHGFLELDNNTAERAMRPIAIGRKNYLFLGSEKGGKSAAICYSLIETCKLNCVNPQSWLTYALANIQETKLSDLDKLLPWNYVEEG